MKINESKIKQIINEEMAALEDKQYFDHVDEEGGMAKSQLYKIAKYAIMLHDALDDDAQLEAWVQSKITLASEYVGKVKHYLEYEMGLQLEDPELEIQRDIEPQGQPSEPMMYVDGDDVYEIDDEDAYLMEE
jgi:hypothetical protein